MNNNFNRRTFPVYCMHIIRWLKLIYELALDLFL